MYPRNSVFHKVMNGPTAQFDIEIIIFIFWRSSVRIYSDFFQVSPFAGDAVICPKSFSPKFAKMTVANAGVDVTLDNMIRMQSVMFPQSPEAMGEILFNGYRDAVHFLQKHGQIKHTVELTVKTKYSPKDILKVGVIFMNLLLLQKWEERQIIFNLRGCVK